MSNYYCLSSKAKKQDISTYKTLYNYRENLTKRLELLECTFEQINGYYNERQYCVNIYLSKCLKPLIQNNRFTIHYFIKITNLKNEITTLPNIYKFFSNTVATGGISHLDTNDEIAGFTLLIDKNNCGVYIDDDNPGEVYIFAHHSIEFQFDINMECFINLPDSDFLIIKIRDYNLYLSIMTSLRKEPNQEWLKLKEQVELNANCSNCDITPMELGIEDFSDNILKLECLKKKCRHLQSRFEFQIKQRHQAQVAFEEHGSTKDRLCTEGTNEIDLYQKYIDQMKLNKLNNPSKYRRIRTAKFTITVRKIRRNKFKNLTVQKEVIQIQLQKNQNKYVIIDDQKIEILDSKPVVDEKKKVDLNEGRKITCVVCLEQERCFLFRKCGHGAVCYNCIDQFHRKKQIYSCPICSQLSDIQKVFF